MKVGRRLLGLGVVCSSTLGVVIDSDPAYAEKTCVMIQETGELKCRLVDEDPSVEGTIGTNWKGDPMYRWERSNLGLGIEGPAGGNSGCAFPNGGGAAVALRLYSITTKAQIWSSYNCVVQGDSLPEPPPPPPTAAEILAAEDSRSLMTVKPQIMPPPAGDNSFGALVNRPIWAWCDQPEPVHLELELRGWRVETTMEVVSMKWATDGGALSSTTTGDSACGKAPAPGTDGKGAAWSWIPKQKGIYTISLTTVWAGEATLYYQGVATGSEWLGEHEYTASIDQTVVEMQALNK